MKLMDMLRSMVLLVVSFGTLFGQQSRVESRASGQVRIVDFGKKLEIHQTEATGKYVAFRVGPKDGLGRAFYVYDRNGNAVFQKAADSTENIEQLGLSDSLGCAVKIDLRYRSDEVYDRYATAYDLKTGSELWKTKLPYHVGAYYEYRASPDGLHMINAGESAPLPILNLRDGSRVAFAPVSDIVGADWLDNERIVLAKQQFTLNPKAKPYLQKSTEKRKDLDSLIYLRLRQRAYLDRGDISKEEYETRRAELTKSINELRKELKAERSNQVRPVTLLAATRLMIYNIRTSRIELEKDIHTPGGVPIVVSAGAAGEIGAINVDRATGSIYFFANVGSYDVGNECLSKLDRNLDPIFVTMLSGRLEKVRAGDALYFVTRNVNGTSVLDNKNGEARKATELKTRYGTEKLDYSAGLRVRTVVSGVSISKDRTSVEFAERKGEER